MTSGSKRIPYGRHFIDDDDLAAVRDVLTGDWLTQGPAIERFEKQLAEYVGAKYAVTVSNGTAGLHIACLAGGLTSEGRSLTSALTFVASANAPLYCGAASDLGDINPDDLCLSASAVEHKIKSGEQLDVIIPVHFAGLSADVGAIRKAAPNSIIIEDACHALGGQDHDGKNIGACTHSDMAVFSFHPVKPITSGEGGAVTTNDKDLYEKLLMLRSHGITRDDTIFMDRPQSLDGGATAPWYYEQQMLGFNYRMTDIQAALGSSQLHKIDRFTQRRREIVARYDEAFKDVPHMTLTQSAAHQRNMSSHHLYVAMFDYAALGGTRSDFIQRLGSNGVGCQVHYIPVYRQPLHRQRLGDVMDQFPHTESYYAQALSLPVFPKMTDEEVETVITGVKRSLDE